MKRNHVVPQGRLHFCPTSNGRADVAIAVTGVAGPDEQDGQPVGTVWYGIAVPGHEPEAITARLPFDRERIRQFSTITLLNSLRMKLLSLG